MGSTPDQDWRPWGWKVDLPPTGPCRAAEMLSCLS